MVAVQETGSATGSKASAASAQVALYGVYEISKLLTAPGRLEVTLSRVLLLLSSFLDMRHGLIALLGEGGAPEIVVGAGWSEATAKRYFEHLPERAIGRIVVTQVPLLVPNINEEPLFENWKQTEWGSPERALSFVGVPIKDRGNVVGTLTIDREPDPDTQVRLDEDIRFLSMVANLVGQTVRLHRMVAHDRDRLIEEQHRLQKVVARTAPEGHVIPEHIIGASGAIRGVIDKVRLVARSHTTVLLRGESGTGKELFARTLHDLSPRKERAFVSVNCAALAESVLESELFGHEKGAFTGAAATRKGRFELADGGTLFLDEIGEISPAFQAKLLRVLQEGELERVGGSATLKVDVRLIAATNRNLEEAVSKGQFRADLYYRISVVPILLPPLRARPDDIPLLAHEFLRRHNDEHGTAVRFSPGALDVLTRCTFPGNVRELENCVRRTATLAPSSTIAAGDFACAHDECMSALLWKTPGKIVPPGYVPLPIIANGDGSKAPSSAVTRATAAWSPARTEKETPALGGAPHVTGKGGADERTRLVEAMDAAGWVQAKAARLLGITPRQIGYALKKHDIPIRKF